VITHSALPYLVYSFGILLREGVETIVVVVALASGAKQAEQHGQVRDVYAGAGLALAASIVSAWIVGHVLSDDASDRLEGALQLLAAGTLFYVSSWLTAKTQNDRWRQFIKTRLESSRQSNAPSLALALTAFLAVIREGGETIIFFQALLAGTSERAEVNAIAAGIAAASIALVVIFVLLRQALLRIPLNYFFKITSVLLYLMAVIFVGNGIASWQEAGLVGATFIDHLPTIKALGIFPTIQTLGAQLTLTAFALISLLQPWTRIGRRTNKVRHHVEKLSA
jgi:high-affinity iron transporter